VGSLLSFRIPWLSRGAESEQIPSSRGDAESALVARLAAGELAALGVAYDAHHGCVRTFARRLLADADAAEDLVHETFLQLPAAARSFRREASLRTLLLSIASRRASRHLRSASRRRAAMARFEREPNRTPATPEDEVIAGERRQALLRALDALSIKLRLVLVLCDVEGRTSVEVAAILGLSDVTVRTRLCAARKKLREALDKEAR
jgi:RNA polymerase sigma-70 factor, ECF subfamily